MIELVLLGFNKLVVDNFVEWVLPYIGETVVGGLVALNPMASGAHSLVTSFASRFTWFQACNPLKRFGRWIGEMEWIRKRVRQFVSFLSDWVVRPFLERIGIFEWVWKNGGNRVATELNKLILQFGDWVFEYFTDVNPATASKDFFSSLFVKLRNSLGEDFADSVKSTVLSMFEALIPILEKHGVFGTR